jgi:hypothetical protein
MRQTHVAGERMFVDYAGTTMEVINGIKPEESAPSWPPSGRIL